MGREEAMSGEPTVTPRAVEREFQRFCLGLALAVVVLWGVTVGFSTAFWKCWIAVIGGLSVCPWLLKFGTLYLRGPSIVRRAFQKSYPPEHLPVEESDVEVAPEAGLDIPASRELIETLGFAFLGHFRTALSGAPPAVGYVSLWENGRLGDEIRIVTASTHNQRRLADGRLLVTKNMVTVLLVTTRFTDGTRFVTSNGTTLGTFRRDPKRDSLSYPKIRDPKRLYQIHRKALDHRDSLSQVEPLRIKDPLSYLSQTSILELQRQLDSGECYVDASANLLRPTWKGAILMSLRLRWPWLQLRRWSLNRRSAKFLARFPEL